MDILKLVSTTMQQMQRICRLTFTVNTKEVVSVKTAEIIQRASTVTNAILVITDPLGDY